MSRTVVQPPLDVATHFLPAAAADASISELLRASGGSEILKIAADIRALKASGKKVANLTVGDFDPTQFPAAPALVAATQKALGQGHTNYPPSDGTPELRKAIVRYYERELGLKYPVESVQIAAGARPIIYSTYRAAIDPGDVALFPVPSWNNSYYVQLTGAQCIAVKTSAEHNFFPTVAELREHLPKARLLVINSPSNPTGTVISKDALGEMTRLLVEENRRRAQHGRKALYLLYDQVYWTLTFGGARHYTPVELVPESAPYVIFLDAVSKAFAATGLRVGWCVAPPQLAGRMRDFLGHVGAWAPKPEQMATAEFLDDAAAVQAFGESFRSEVKHRLELFHEGFEALRRDGFPVQSIDPQGAIYLSVRFDLIGKHFHTNEEIRRFLLEDAGFAVVPFQAFGLREETGWFRLSVGAVSREEIAWVLPRLREALAKVR